MKKTYLSKLFSPLLICAALTLSELEADLYLDPGIVGMHKGKWVGSDHLLGLSENIGVAIEILPSHMEQEIDKEALKKILFDKFKEADIAVSDAKEGGLPMFHLMIIVMEGETTGVSLIEGRLLEAVKLERVNLEPEITFQAITWDALDMISFAKKDMRAKIQETATEIAKVFAERYTRFKRAEKG